MTLEDAFIVVCVWMWVAALAGIVVNTGDDDE